MENESLTKEALNDLHRLYLYLHHGDEKKTLEGFYASDVSIDRENGWIAQNTDLLCDRRIVNIDLMGNDEFILRPNTLEDLVLPLLSDKQKAAHALIMMVYVDIENHNKEFELIDDLDREAAKNFAIFYSICGALPRKTMLYNIFPLEVAYIYDKVIDNPYMDIAEFVDNVFDGTEIVDYPEDLKALFNGSDVEGKVGSVKSVRTGDFFKENGEYDPNYDPDNPFGDKE
ncbi:MAG: hypothetical protein K5694_04700 [Bacilli bacterium]|nr:hypothetical protein [Bacilli bacterium]